MSADSHTFISGILHLCPTDLRSPCVTVCCSALVTLVIRQYHYVEFSVFLKGISGMPQQKMDGLFT